MVLEKLHKRFPHHIPIMTDWCYEQMKGEKKMFIKRNEYEELKAEIAALQAELRAETKRCVELWTQKTEDYLSNYSYAVLLPKDSYVLKVWNNGRFEENVRAIEVSQDARTFPYFKIEK